MPLSVATFYAMRYIYKNSLTNRLGLLSNSYKLQILGLTSAILINFESQNTNAKNLYYNNKFIFIHIR